MNTAVGHNAPAWLCVESSAYFDACGRGSYDDRGKHGKAEARSRNRQAQPMLIRFADGMTCRAVSVYAAAKMLKACYPSVRKCLTRKGIWHSGDGTVIVREERTA